MGLDTVEIILQTEEVFGISLPDEECGQIVTVGDLYRAVLGKLDLIYMPSAEIEDEKLGSSRLPPPERRLLGRVSHRVSPNPHDVPWTAPDVWYTLRAIIVDQLQIDEAEVREGAAFLRDLGCD